MAALILPRAVLTHLKAGVLAALGPEPVLTIVWSHPAPVTAAKQARPSLTTVQAGSRLCLAKGAMEAVEGHALDEPGKDLLALITCGDESRWRFPHAPILTAIVHPAPVQRLLHGAP